LFFEETLKELKIDVDEKLPAWEKLMRIFNFLYLFPNARIERRFESDHLFAPVRSDLTTRAGLGDCRGRLFFSEITNSDIIFKRKGIARLVKKKGKILIGWERRPCSYEPCDLKDILRMPYWNFRWLSNGKKVSRNFKLKRR